MSDIFQGDLSQDIAVIGLSCRFPGAATAQQFWQNIRAGVESISFFSDAELEGSGVPAELLSDPNYVRAAAVLNDIDQFDAAFFGFTPREAEIMDPQQRLFLECAWQALEDAGYDPSSWGGSIGVYAGCNISTYLHNILANKELTSAVDGFQITVGNDKDHLSTRVSYKLNLKGPSLTIQTACSTSLVAVCLACQSLLNNECDMALAGGVGIRVPEKVGYLYQDGGILSPDGHCRPFDTAARGTVRGNGLGIVVCKRLADALEDRDSIRAVIKGWAVNNDGSEKVGYTAPSIDGQAEVIASAQAIAGVDPASISYIEAHGTGTRLGDPIEISALTQAFRNGTNKKRFCAIGSVKSNMGHLDSAAGVASLIKTILALEHKALPPSLHYRVANPEIDFEDTPFYINNELSDWKHNSGLRRAGVSSFGIGGTNAHIVLEEALDIGELSTEGNSNNLLVLSARSEPALEKATANLVAHLQQHPEESLGDVAYTCQVGRKAFAHRRAVVCNSVLDAVAALSSLDPSRVFTSVPSHAKPKIAFLFPGQGAQHLNMCEELYRFEPIFAEHVDQCSKLLEPLLNLDLKSFLYSSRDDQEEAGRRLDQTELSQPALFVMEYALAKLWISWGVLPSAMIGHSIGEYVAACLSGVLSLEAALTLVAERGRLMQRMPTGAMLAVFLNEEKIQPLLNELDLSLATVNGPLSCVISGDRDSLAELSSRLDQQGVGYRYLRTSHAFHSRMMDQAVDPFIECVRRVNLGTPQIPYVSNVTGTWLDPEVAREPRYWGDHLRLTVRFADGIRCLIDDDYGLLLEVGPGEQLSRLARQCEPDESGPIIVASCRDPRDSASDISVLEKALGRVWVAGAQVNWAAVNSNQHHRRIALPTYPFERRSYWVAPPRVSPEAKVYKSLTTRKLNMEDWFHTPVWRPKLLTEIVPDDGPESDIGWLVFSDENGLGSGIVNRLDELGKTMTVVRRGTSYLQRNQREYVINPRNPNHYVRLVRELHAQNRDFSRIVHAWTIAELSQIIPSQARDLSFYSLLFLAQAIGNLGISTPIRIGIISSGAHAVTEEDSVCPIKATLVGPCRVIPQEYTNVGCKSIDVDSDSISSVDEILAELDGFDSPCVAYRKGERFALTYESVKIPAPERAVPRLREGGVYLITGGLGGIGLAIARGLAEQVRAKLVLTRRSALPWKAVWNSWLRRHSDQDKISRSIRALQELDRLGAEVLVVNADVSSLVQMRSVLLQTFRRFGRLNGVIHAAGIAGGGLIQFKERQIAESVLWPKVRGTQVLDFLLQQVPLDFFVLFSSLASIVGGIGQVDYCAANAFLDAYAHHRRASGSRFTVSIDWPTWKFVGMAADTQVPPHMEDIKKEWLESGIESSEGFQAFLRVLNSDFPQVAVSAFEPQVAQQEVTQDEVIGSSASVAPVTLSMHPRPNLASVYRAPGNQLEQTIAGIWQEVLGIEPIGAQDNFFELGGHSLLAVKVASRLRDAFHWDVPAGAVFNAPTVSELANMLHRGPKDKETIAEQLDLVEHLSEEEVRKLLAESDSSLMQPRAKFN